MACSVQSDSVDAYFRCSSVLAVFYAVRVPVTTGFVFGPHLRCLTDVLLRSAMVLTLGFPDFAMFHAGAVAWSINDVRRLDHGLFQFINTSDAIFSVLVNAVFSEMCSIFSLEVFQLDLRRLNDGFLCA